MKGRCAICQASLIVLSVLAVVDAATAGEESGGSNSYARLLCSVIESANSGDPEIRRNAGEEGLAYLDGEASNILRFMFLVKEDHADIRRALRAQLRRSGRDVATMEVIRSLLEGANLTSDQRARFQEALAVLQENRERGDDHARVKMLRQPDSYGGPLAHITIEDLSDESRRGQAYESLVAEPSRSSSELLGLFLQMEVSTNLAGYISQQMRSREALRIPASREARFTEPTVAP